MFDRFLVEWNQVAGVILAALVNAFPVSLFITAAAWLSMLLRRRWNAASRYWIWSMVLAFVVFMPAGHPFLPDHSKAVAMMMKRQHASPSNFSGRPTESHALPVFSPVSPIRNADLPCRLTISGIFLLLWVAMATVQLARLALAFRNTVSLRASAITPMAELETKWRERLAACGVRRRVTLGISNAVTTPAVAGYARPIVLLPRSVADHLSDNELDQILLHELAHVRRLDDWAIAVQRLIEAVFVFHPLVRLIGNRIGLEREIACDDWVLATQGPQSYASCLTKLAEFCVIGQSPRLTTAAMERKSQLGQRIELLLDRTRSIATRASLRGLGSVAAILLALSLVSLRLPRLIAYPEPQSPAPPQVPPAPPPRAPAVPESHPTTKGPLPPPAPAGPQAPATPRAPDDLNSLVIYSEGGQSYSYGNYSDSEYVFAHADRDKSARIEFRRGGKSYVIRDPAIVRAAQEILRPQEELGRRQAELGEKQAQLGEEQAQLGARQAKAAEKPLDREDWEKLKGELKRLQAEISKIKVEETMKTAADAQAQLGELQSQLAEAQSEMGEAQSKTGADQSRLGEQQSRLGEQQSRLGEMQSKLGEQQSRLAKEVRRKLDDLLNRAIAKGLSQPVP